LAIRLDAAVRTVRPDDWRDVQARELIVKQALFDILQDVDAVERIFPVVKAQSEY
jgi:type I restriction enzyme R subunit